MSGLPINVTPAGRAALVNAENTGTAPVRIAQIGVTSSAAGLVAGALAGELKRLVTFAGAVVAADTIHVTIRDDSADVYSMRGYALYLEDGTLFAWYAQPGVILEKSAQAMMLLSADVRFVEIDATSLTFGDTNWINPPATTTVQGVVELADNPESIAGTDGTRAMTPAGAKALLDDRLGAGAPSAFVKGLLAVATAAAMRIAIGLGNVATRNEGHNNGLDADLLDGQHGTHYLAWANLTGKPLTFPPSGHQHTWSEINDPPSTAIRWPAWGEVTGKPLTFPPGGHIHAAADIQSGVFDVERIPDLAIAKVTNLTTVLAGKAPLANPGFSGTATAPVFTANAGHLVAQALPTQNAHLWLRDETGVNQGLLFWDRGDGDVVRLARYNAAGTAIEGSLSIYATTVTFNGYGLWHAGNFDPGSKAAATHYHDERYTQLFPGYISDANGVNGFCSAPTSEPSTNTPNGSWNHLLNLGGGDYAAQIASPWFEDAWYTRSRRAGAWAPWYKLWSSYNFNPATKANLSGDTFTGNVTAPKFIRSSSLRYKRGIRSIKPSEALRLLASIRFVEYVMRADGSRSAGVIAEDLADGPLDFVVQRTASGEPEAVDYEPLFVIACSALQGLAADVADLKAKV